MSDLTIPLHVGYNLFWHCSGTESVPTPEGWRVNTHGHGPVRTVNHTIYSEKNIALSEVLGIINKLAIEMEAKFHEEVERRIQERAKK
jgi:hypothetical protein